MKPVIHTNLQPAISLEEDIPVLNGLRGVAILLVFGYHCAELPLGWTGVDLFFVLSGFLITGKLVQAHGSSTYFRNFYLRRILRICPLYYALLAITLIITFLPHYSSRDSIIDLRNMQGYYWTFTLNFYEALHGWPRNSIFLPVWSLCVEVQFYLIWPLVVLFMLKGNGRFMKVLPALILFALAFRIFAGHFITMKPLYQYVLLPSRIDGFALGSLLYLVLQKGKEHWRKYIHIAGIMAFIGLVTIWIYKDFQWGSHDPVVSRYGYTLDAIVWCWLLYISVASRSSIWKKILSSGAMVNTGKYSYAAYLFHIPVYVGLGKVLPYDSIHPMLMAAITFLLTFLLAYISYHFYEKKWLRRKAVFPVAQPVEQVKI